MILRVTEDIRENFNNVLRYDVSIKLIYCK